MASLSGRLSLNVDMTLASALDIGTAEYRLGAQTITPGTC